MSQTNMERANQEEVLKSIDVDSYVSQGQRIYDRIKTKLEPEHIGEIVAIDIDTEDYFLGKNVIEAVSKAREKYPNKIFHTVKVGFKAVHCHR